MKFAVLMVGSSTYDMVEAGILNSSDRAAHKFIVNVTKTNAVFSTLGILVIATLGIFAWKVHDLPPGSLRIIAGIQISYPGGTRVSVASHPDSVVVRVDGEALVQRLASAPSLTVKTRLLVITPTAPSEFRVISGGNSAGEQVEVIAGLVNARKAYASRDSAPQTLAAGEMVLINQDIDLMEKEKFDLSSTRAWRDALLASIAKERR